MELISRQAPARTASTQNSRKATFKPAPPVTTPPPPRREYVPHPLVRPTTRPKTQIFSQSRSISSNQLVKLLPPRRASVQVPTDVEVSTLSTMIDSDDLESRPVLPPRPSATATVSSPDTTALVLYEDRPALPPRKTSTTLLSPSTTSNALVVVQSVPPLPPRNYTLPSPPFPSRTYSQTNPSAPKMVAEAMKPPKKPQHLSSRSFSVPTVQSDHERLVTQITSELSTIPTGPGKPVPRLTPNELSVTNSRAVIPTLLPKSTVTVTTEPVRAETPPNTPPKTPHIAELIKSLEARSVA